MHSSGHRNGGRRYALVQGEGYNFVKQYMKMDSQPAGFEPARGNPIGFQVQRLNHSATTAAGKVLC